MSKKKKNELILTYTESRHGGEAIDPEESWSSREDEQIEWNPCQVFIDEKGKKAREKTKEWHIECLHCDEPVKLGDKIWVVVVRYTTGGTFCRTCGAWHVEAVFKNESKALHVADLIERDEAVQRKWKLNNPSYKRKAGDCPPKDMYVTRYGYKCWRGHFESLEYVQVESFIVN